MTAPRFATGPPLVFSGQHYGTDGQVQVPQVLLGPDRVAGRRGGEAVLVPIEAAQTALAGRHAHGPCGTRAAPADRHAFQAAAPLPEPPPRRQRLLIVSRLRVKRR